jgi:saccharopine dehydrogenase (NAD+, L-lysine-forming)
MSAPTLNGHCHGRAPVLVLYVTTGRYVVEKIMADAARILLRAEVKGHEHRSPLTPTNAKALLDSGRFSISVERSDGSGSCRIFKDEEYERVGCELVPAGSWPAYANGAVILGLKELPESEAPHTNDHIFFAHAFKLQDGAHASLARVGPR